MAYIKVFAVVLCSCFIQDALSATKPNPDPNKQPFAKRAVSKQTPAVPRLQTVADMKQAPKQTVADMKQAPKQTAAAPRQVSMATPEAQAGAAKKTVRRTITTKRQVAVPAAPPSKYPALDELKNASWATAERLNQANEPGKLVVRAVRNTVADVLANPSFWDAAVAVVGQLKKDTQDERRAESRVRVCDAITGALTRPGAAGRFEMAADAVYGAADRVDLTPYLNVVVDVLDTVEHDKLTDALAKASRAVDAIDLNPAMVSRAFGRVTRYMGKTGVVTANTSILNGVTKIGMALNRNNSRR